MEKIKKLLIIILVSLGGVSNASNIDTIINKYVGSKRIDLIDAHELILVRDSTIRSIETLMLNAGNYDTFLKNHLYPNSKEISSSEMIKRINFITKEMSSLKCLVLIENIKDDELIENIGSVDFVELYANNLYFPDLIANCSKSVFLYIDPSTKIKFPKTYNSTNITGLRCPYFTSDFYNFENLESILCVVNANIQPQFNRFKKLTELFIFMDSPLNEATNILHVNTLINLTLLYSCTSYQKSDIEIYLRHRNLKTLNMIVSTCTCFKFKDFDNFKTLGEKNNVEFKYELVD